MVTPKPIDDRPGTIPAAGRERIVLRRVLTWALAVPLTLMAVLAATLFGQIQSLLKADDWVEHTDLVIDRAHHVQQLVVDMQTGMRGYLLTGDPNFLQPYTAAESTINAAFDGLGRLVADNPAQTRSLNELRGAYVQWHLHAHETIALSIDVTGRKRAAKRIKGLNRQLRRRLERIAALRRIDTAITASLDLRHTLDVCLE